MGKKRRADWTDNDGVRHRQRFNTKGDADEHLDRIKAELRNGTYVAPQRVWLFGVQAIERAIATWCLPLALRWADVNLDRGTIDFRRTVSTARVKGETSSEKHRWFDPKTKKGIREIPIPGELVTALRE